MKTWRTSDEIGENRNSINKKKKKKTLINPVCGEGFAVGRDGVYRDVVLSEFHQLYQFMVQRVVEIINYKKII